MNKPTDNRSNNGNGTAFRSTDMDNLEKESMELNRSVLYTNCVDIALDWNKQHNWFIPCNNLTNKTILVAS